MAEYTIETTTATEKGLDFYFDQVKNAVAQKLSVELETVTKEMALQYMVDRGLEALVRSKYQELNADKTVDEMALEI